MLKESCSQHDLLVMPTSSTVSSMALLVSTAALAGSLLLLTHLPTSLLTLRYGLKLAELTLFLIIATVITAVVSCASIAANTRYCLHHYESCDQLGMLRTQFVYTVLTCVNTSLLPIVQQLKLASSNCSTCGLIVIYLRRSPDSLSVPLLLLLLLLLATTADAPRYRQSSRRVCSAWQRRPVGLLN
jgi:hypothetical protein